MASADLGGKARFLRASRARTAYVCAGCGATIGPRDTYFRDEPHPMARRHRGVAVRHLCAMCVTGHPASEFSRKEEHGQRLLPFAQAVVNLPPVMVQAAVIELGHRTDEGAVLQGVTVPWFEIVKGIMKDPKFLYEVPWRTLEELIAGAYYREGWDEVTITPRSGDGGRDIIAVKRRVCQVRIIDQVKAYSEEHKVTANDVRALLGVLSSDLNISKGFVTTSGQFAPGIMEDPSIKPFLPYRLELRDGAELRSWLLQVAKRTGHVA